MTLPPNLVAVIHQDTAALFETLVGIRRELHQHPELSGQETWTASYIAQLLDRLGLTVRTNVGGHGIVADLITNPAKPTVALRVDMDALPMQESRSSPYCSQIPGVMHACGHDVHSAIGFGTAAVLSNLKAYLPGNIRFLFQPEEEEISGALKMIRAGALANPKPQAIFGLHVAPLPVGQIGLTDGLFLAGFDHYLISITPQPGARWNSKKLNAVAQRCCQTILDFNEWQLPANCQEMETFWQTMQEGPSNLQRFTIYDANMDTEDPQAWIGQLGVGVKAANQHLRRAALGRVKASLNTICRASHTTYHIECVGTMSDMRNNAALAQATFPALSQVVEAKNLIHLNAAFPFNCEDFAYYTEHIPGLMIWLGAANPAEGKYAMLHTDDFDVDESCLQTGTAVMTVLLLEALSQEALSQL